MEILEYLQIVKKHVTMIVLLCLSTVITTFLLTYLIPEVYESAALILIRPHESITFSDKTASKELLNFPVSGGLSKAETVSNTYIQIIKSRALAEKVVRMLQWDIEKPKVPAETYYEKLNDFLKKKFKDLLYVAKQLLRHGKVMERPSLFNQSVQDFQANIELEAIKDSLQIEIKYSADDPNKAAAAANAAMELFLKYMAELNSRTRKTPLIYLKQRVAETGMELEQARRVLREFKEKNKTIIFSDEATEEIQLISELEEDLEKSEVKLARLVELYTSTHPNVRSIQAEKKRLLFALGQRRNKIKELPNIEKEITTLNLKVKVSEEIYRLLIKKYETARVRAGEYLTELEVVSTAVPSLYPTKPIRGKYVAVALPVALLIGIGLTFFLEYLNITIRGIQDVERVLQLPILATIPQMGLTSNPK